MTMNLVVPLGEVRFVFHLANPQKLIRVESIGIESYARLTVPPGVWFGFQGEASGNSLLTNVADMVHDPEEVVQKSVSEFTFDWCLK